MTLLQERRASMVSRVVEEAQRQDDKWGPEREHEMEMWLTILMEEVGELAQASLGMRYGSDSLIHVQEEAIQVAAVALQIIEHVERRF